MTGIGTIVNVAAVVAGSCIGLAVGSRLPKRFMDILFQGLGLVTIIIGVSMALESENLIISVVGILFGAVLGELMNLDKGLDNMAGWLRRKMKFRSERFNDALVTATVLYCVGSMSILGSIEDGLGQYPRLLYTKSLMDGVSSVALSATMGIGVIFSIIPMLLYQGLLTLFAGSVSGILTPPLIAEMTAVGGVMLIGIGINLLGLKKISVVNMLPALVVAPLVTYLFF